MVGGDPRADGGHLASSENEKLPSCPPRSVPRTLSDRVAESCGQNIVSVCRSWRASDDRALPIPRHDRPAEGSDRGLAAVDSVTTDRRGDQEDRLERTLCAVVFGVDVLDTHALGRGATLGEVALAVLAAVVQRHAEREDDTETLEGDVDAGTLDEARALDLGEEEGGEDAQALTDLYDRYTRSDSTSRSRFRRILTELSEPMEA